MVRDYPAFEHLELHKAPDMPKPGTRPGITTPEHPLVRASRTGCQPKTRAELKAKQPWPQ